MHKLTLDSETDLDWDDARMFLAVARAGQILAASRTLGVNQATLSRRVSSLEKSLGTKLLMRRTSGSELTEAGNRLLTVLERVETEFIRARADLARTGAAIAGTVRIGAPDGLGVGFIAPRLAQLCERHPDLRPQLVPAPRSFSLSRREADIAVMVGRPESGRLVARKLADYTLGLYASKAYLSRYAAPETAADLAGHRLIGYVEDLIHTPALDYAREFVRNWRSHVEVSSALGQLEAVRAGAGIGVLHDYLARRHDDLVPILSDLRVTRSYWLAIHENLRDIARIRATVDFLVAAVHAEQASFTPA